MYCQHCGTPLPDSAKFCPDCGEAVDSAAPEMRYPNPSQNSGGSGRKKPGARKKKLIAAAAAVIVLLAVICIALYMGGHNGATGKYDGDRNHFNSTESDRPDDPVSEVSTTVQIPDPAVYLSVSPSGEKEGYLFFETDGDLLTAMDAYIHLLTGSYGFAQTDYDKNDRAMEAYLACGTDNDVATVEIAAGDLGEDYLEHDLPSRYFLHFTYDEGFELISAEVYDWPAVSDNSAAAPAAVETPEPTPAAVSGPILPSLQSFGNNCLEEGDTAVYADYSLLYCWSSINEKFVMEYLELLKSYGFVQRDYHETSGMIYQYTFDYTGSGSVSTFDLDKKYLDCDGIALYFYYFPAGSSIEYHIAFGDGLTYADTGERTSQTLTPLEGSPAGGASSVSSSSSGSNIAPFAQKDCSICRGTGDCTQCGGDGYLYSSASGKEDRNCWKCSGTGRCTYCNGTGKQ